MGYFSSGKVQVLCMSSIGQLPSSHLYTEHRQDWLPRNSTSPAKKVHIIHNYILFGDFSANSSAGQYIFPYWLAVKAKFPESSFCGF